MSNSIKRTGKITLCGMMAALAATFMLTSLFPYLTYAIPAVAGLFIMIAVIEINNKWGLAAYIVSAILVLILPADNEAKLLYIAFFGYYPIIKALLESKCNRVVEFILKFAILNIALVLSYGVLSTVLGIDVGDMGEFGKYTGVILLVAANVIFPIYDLAVSRMAQFYLMRLHSSVSRIFNKK